MRAPRHDQAVPAARLDRKKSRVATSLYRLGVEEQPDFQVQMFQFAGRNGREAHIILDGAQRRLIDGLAKGQWSLVQPATAAAQVLAPFKADERAGNQ